MPTAVARVTMPQVGLRVVIVDDDDRFRAMARRTLIADGADIIGEATDAASTIDGMATWHPDVILMDIGLPDVDGVEVARRLQDRVDVETPPIVLISTRDVAYGERLATTVAAGYLPKDGLSLAAILRIIST